MSGYQPPDSGGLLVIRGQKTFTGAANLGAVGACPIFDTTGVVLLNGLWWRCTTDLANSVDGATITVGVTGTTAGILNWTAVDLDTIDADEGPDIENGASVPGLSYNLLYGTAAGDGMAVFANILMTVGTQAITGGVLEFYGLYRPLSADGALTLGTGMVAI